MDRVSSKTGLYPALKPYKLDLQEPQLNIYSYFKRSTVIRQSHNSTGHTPGVYNQPYIKRMPKLNKFSLQETLTY